MVPSCHRAWRLLPIAALQIPILQVRGQDRDFLHPAVSSELFLSFALISKVQANEIHLLTPIVAVIDLKLLEASSVGN